MENQEVISSEVKTKFEDVLYQWLNNSKISLKGGSITKYQYLIEAHIIPSLGEMPMSDISSKVVNSFLLEKLEEGRLHKKGSLSPSYVRSMMLIISAAHQLGEAEKLCPSFTSPIYKPVSQRKELKILSLEQQLSLEKLLYENLNLTALGILITLYEGLRIGEICALSWDDIDLTEKIIRVYHTISRVTDENGKTRFVLDSPKTTSSFRTIPISSNLLPVLKKFQEKSTGHYVISEKQEFIIPRTYEYRFHKIMKKTESPDINYHALRHTFATRCVEAGVDIKSLSEILGHASVNITLNTYVHSSMDLKRRQLEKLSAHTKINS